VRGDYSGVLANGSGTLAEVAGDWLRGLWLQLARGRARSQPLPLFVRPISVVEQSRHSEHRWRGSGVGMAQDLKRFVHRIFWLLARYHWTYSSVAPAILRAVWAAFPPDSTLTQGRAPKVLTAPLVSPTAHTSKMPNHRLSKWRVKIQTVSLLLLAPGFRRRKPWPARAVLANPCNGMGQFAAT
jgi:hypothetical protein